MAGFTDVVEAALLDYFVDTYGAVTKYIGLSSTAPTEAGGTFTEPSGGGYARVSTVAADWGAAVAGDPSTKSNTVVKTFATATADWAAGVNLTHFGIFDASVAGNLLAWGVLGTAKPVMSGDTASFAAGALVLKLGDPGDTF